MTTAAVGAVATVAPRASAGATARVDKTSWWNRGTGVATDRLPSDPLTPALPANPVPAGTVPEGAIAVGAQDDVDKVAGVGILIDAPAGASIVTFTLTLTEAEGELANINHTGVTLVACPILDFWAAGAGERWDTRPRSDCAIARSEATRNDDGTWVFDLTDHGLAWLDPFGTLTQNGVLIMPAGMLDDAGTLPEGAEPAPPGFQVSFVATGAAGPAVELVTVGGAPPGDPFAPPPSSAPTPTTTAASPSPAPPPRTPGTLPRPATTVPPATTAPATTTTTVAGPVAAPVAAPPAAGPPGLLEGLGPGVVVGALALLAGLGTISLGLGPLGEPRPRRVHRGAVSRALERRRSGPAPEVIRP